MTAKQSVVFKIKSWKCLKFFYTITQLFQKESTDNILCLCFTGNIGATACQDHSEMCGYLFPLLLYRSTSGSGVVSEALVGDMQFLHTLTTAKEDRTFPLCACINIYSSSSAYQY